MPKQSATPTATIRHLPLIPSDLRDYKLLPLADEPPDLGETVERREHVVLPRDARSCNVEIAFHDAEYTKAACSRQARMAKSWRRPISRQVPLTSCRKSDIIGAEVKGIGSQSARHGQLMPSLNEIRHDARQIRRVPCPFAPSQFNRDLRKRRMPR